MPKHKKKPEKVVVPTGGWQAAAKQPVVPAASTDKVPVVRLDVNHEEVLQRRLVWRFGEVDRGGAWPPSDIGAAGMAKLLEKMADYETMRIGEIFKPGSEHGKTYDTSALPSHAQKRLIEIERDDEAEIARLRCGNKPRLYGFLREHIFHVVWWDAEHKVWPSSKK